MRMEELLKNNAKNLKAFAYIPHNNLEYIKEKSIMRKNQQNKIFRKVIYSAAGLAASFVIIMNSIPALAFASYDLPVIGSIVRVVTFGRFHAKNNGYETNVVTPKIEGLLNKELENKLNIEFAEHSQSIIAAFEQDIKELKKEYGNDFYLGVDANYTIRTDNENVLAIDTYIVNTVGSSSTKHSFYTINKKTGTLVELRDLFQENADYITPISEYIKDEMKKKNDDGTGHFWIGNDGTFDGFEKIKESQNFFLNDAGNIVICFDKYEVAIGAQGCPEFEIPNNIVKDILK